MKRAAGLALLLLAAGWTLRAEAPARPEQLSFLTTGREVAVADAARQNYVVVDSDAWEHARSDLADLRLYDGSGAEVPYALVRESEETSRSRLAATVFNLARRPGGTEFLLDIPPGANALRQYDRVALDLATIDFIGKAQVEGADAATGAPWAKIGTYSIFDLTREKLGQNFELQLPPQRYRYLRIVLLAPVKPEDVKGATVADYQTRPAAWLPVGSTPAVSQGRRAVYDQGATPPMREVEDRRYTTITWSEPEHIPLDRIAFEVAGDANFSRKIELFDGKGRALAAGDISRIHLTRGSEKVDCDRLMVDLGDIQADHFALVVYNGDDAALPITRIQPQSVERRLYFDPRNHSGAKLYYGDDKASAPVYDYAKLFQRDPGAVRAQLGPEEHNAAFAGRPDDRPWTDRHGWVVWAALIVAVVGLGAVALRGLKS